MSYEKIGVAEKNPAELSQPSDGITFEIPYGEDRYGITLSDEELDDILDRGYEIAMGRQALLGSGGVIQLGGYLHETLFVDAATFKLEKDERGTDAHINLGIGIFSRSLARRVSGIAHANRYSRSTGRWMFVRYEDRSWVELRDMEEHFGSAIETA